jgi:hypothetical protein
MFIGLAQAQLLARDINGDGVTDAFYDSAQNLTWLADANHAGTTGYADALNEGAFASGAMRQASAMTWAGQLNIYGIDDWRLPRLLEPPTVSQELQDIGVPGDCNLIEGWLCTVGPSEMTALIQQLGAGGFPFSNVQSQAYWTESFFGLGGAWVAFVDPASGASGTTDELRGFAFAWAVREGDVALAIPEPSTYALMLAGLALVGTRLRRKPR